MKCNGKLMEKIEEYGVRLVDFSKITEEENKFLEAYFEYGDFRLDFTDHCGETTAIPISEK